MWEFLLEEEVRVSVQQFSMHKFGNYLVSYLFD